LAGAVPRLLVSSAATGAEGVHELTNPDLTLADGRVVPLQTLQVRVDRRLADDCRLEERIHVHLYAREPLELELELALAADFRPMLAIRHIVDVPPATVERHDVERGVRFLATTGDGVIRSTTVVADREPSSAADGVLRFALSLEPGGHEDIRVTYDLATGDPPAPRVEVAGDRRPEREGVSAWLAERARVHADDELFNRVLQRSLLDLRMLRSPLDGHEYYAAGVPWFATLFGRDSLITALEMLAFDPPIAERTLRLLADRLGRRVDPVHEEEPGKVLHEHRGGEVAALGLSPLTRYFGTVDATPLFLCLLAEHATWRGDLGLFHELRDAADAALGWIDEFGDHDGDGFLDYRASTPEGLRNQGWKDSDDGVVDGRGHPLEPPIALVEPQGYVIRAKRGIAALLERDGDRGRAARLRAEAAALERRLERFWVAERRFYGMALDGEGRLSSALASNQGHLLWAGAVSPERAGAVRDALMGDGMFSGWGIRTLGRDEPAFNPVGYHLGTVWPHDTAIAAAGLRHYGFDEDFTAVFEALLEAASHAEGYRLPELFAGFSRTEFETPVPYPVACHPQAWAAAAIPFLLTCGLGLRADGLERRLRVRRPSLPHWVNRVEVHNLHIAGARVGLLFERAATGGPVALTDATIDGDVEVVLEISGHRS
ncbi:MAG TPA: glycogen debranching N-terminal domain-containing protein, partial [Solirubrobacteraceae bacterium]|nr:glycogen debranching N-terminal domain-containing protein [Solirubrobacteraceae bacterium]